MAKEESGKPLQEGVYLHRLSGIKTIYLWAKLEKRFSFVRGLVLVGSYADGTAAENSDVDVMVLTDGENDAGADKFVKRMNQNPAATKERFGFDITSNSIDINNPNDIDVWFGNLPQTVIYCDESAKSQLEPLLQEKNVVVKWFST